MAEKNSLWKNIRNNAKKNRETGATPKKPTREMLRQERKIKAKQYAEGSFVGDDELPTYRYANKEGVIGGPRVTDKGTWLPTTPDGTLVVNMPEFEVISTGLNSQPNPYSPTSFNDFLNSDANPVNWFLPTGEQQRQPIDPKTGMPFPQSGLATPVYPETELIGIKKGKEAIDAFKHVDFSDMPTNKSKPSIDWNKWSSDAADNPNVVKHLNEIEKKSKKSGTWMKDFDIKDGKVIFKDAPFKGTPEEFVVQQSDNFKKAFPNGVETMYTGSNRHIFDYANHDEWGKGNKAIFGTSSEANAGAYGWDDVNNKAKPNFDPQDPRLTYEGEMRNGDFEGGVHKLGFSKDIPSVTGEGGGRGWRLVDWDDNVAKGTKLRPRNNESLVKEHNEFLQGIYNNGDYLKRDYDIDGFDPNKEYLSTDLYANYITNSSNPEAVAKVNNTIDTMGKRYMLPQTTFALDPKRVPVKSMRHNIMFDMDNPNIYKSILPAIGTGTLGIGAIDKYYNNKQQQAAGGYYPTQGPPKALFKGYAEGGEDDRKKRELAKREDNTDAVTREGKQGLGFLAQLSEDFDNAVAPYIPTGDLAKQYYYNNYSPVEYPNPINAAIPVLKTAWNLINPANVGREALKSKIIGLSTPSRTIGLDKEGSPNIGEEAWKKALGLPTKEKYIVKSQYKPSSASDPNAEYYTINPNVIDKQKIIDYVKSEDFMKRSSEGKSPNSRVTNMDTFSDFVQDDFITKEGYKNGIEDYYQIDPIQKFQISKAWDPEKKKWYASIYDKYDFDSESANKAIKPYEIYDRVYYDSNEKPIKQSTASKVTQAYGNPFANKKSEGGYTMKNNNKSWREYLQYAQGGYTNPYNMYHKDPHYQYDGGGGYAWGSFNPNNPPEAPAVQNYAMDPMQTSGQPISTQNPNTDKQIPDLNANANAGAKDSSLQQSVYSANVMGLPVGAAIKVQDSINQGLNTGAQNIISKKFGMDQGEKDIMFAASNNTKNIPLFGAAVGRFGDMYNLTSGKTKTYLKDYRRDKRNQETAMHADLVNESLKYSQGGNMSNNSLNLRNTMRNKRFAKGGTFDQFGINFIPESAGLHHESANGGVPIGPNALAEGGEAKLQMADGGQYIVSGEVDGANTQSINGETMTQRLKKKLKPFMMGGLASNPKDKENVRRPFDSYSEPAITQAANAAVQETEAVKMQRGGALQYAANGGKLNKDIEKIVMEEYAAAYGGKLPNKYKGKVNMPGSYAKGGNIQQVAKQILSSKGGYVHNQMTQPMLAEGGPSYPKPSITNAQVQKYVDDMNERGMTDPGKEFKTTWQSDLQNRTVDLGKELNSTDLERVKSLYNFRQQNKNPLGFAEGGPIYGDPASEYVYAQGGMYGDPYYRGGQIDYTNDMYSSYAGGGPLVGNVKQPFKGPAAQNRGGMYMTYADGGMMPQDQQMMQQAPQEQMQQQGGQEQMMQMVQQIAQAIMQGENPEKIMAELANSGMPQEQVQQIMQAAMQMAAQQQQQPMQQGQQIMPPQGMMAKGGKMRYDGGGRFNLSGYSANPNSMMNQLFNYTPQTMNSLGWAEGTNAPIDFGAAQSYLAQQQLPNEITEPYTSGFNFNPNTNYGIPGSNSYSTDQSASWEDETEYPTVGTGFGPNGLKMNFKNDKQVTAPANMMMQVPQEEPVVYAPDNMMMKVTEGNAATAQNTDTPWFEEPWYSKAARPLQAIPGIVATITAMKNKKRRLDPELMAAQTVNYEPERIIDREESRRALDAGLRMQRNSAANAGMLAGNTTNAVLNANKGLASRIAESVMREANTNAQLAQQTGMTNTAAKNQFKQINEGMFQNAQTQAIAGLQDSTSKLASTSMENRKQNLQEWIAQNRLGTRSYRTNINGQDVYISPDNKIYDAETGKLLSV